MPLDDLSLESAEPVLPAFDVDLRSGEVALSGLWLLVLPELMPLEPLVEPDAPELLPVEPDVPELLPVEPEPVLPEPP